jgi:hypothetical protein
LRSALLALAAILPAPAAFACNPAPPLPPVLDGYAYDDAAVRALVHDAGSIASARFVSRVDLELSAEPRQSYVFQVIEGWKAIVPRRLVISGYWIGCELGLGAGEVYLLYLDGERLLWAVPARELDSELDVLVDVAWYYDAAGQLVEPLDEP